MFYKLQVREHCNSYIYFDLIKTYGTYDPNEDGGMIFGLLNAFANKDDAVNALSPLGYIATDSPRGHYGSDIYRVLVVFDRVFNGPNDNPATVRRTSNIDVLPGDFIPITLFVQDKAIGRHSRAHFTEVTSMPVMLDGKLQHVSLDLTSGPRKSYTRFSAAAIAQAVAVLNSNYYMRVSCRITRQHPAMALLDLVALLITQYGGETIRAVSETDAREASAAHRRTAIAECREALAPLWAQMEWLQPEKMEPLMLDLYKLLKFVHSEAPESHLHQLVSPAYFDTVRVTVMAHCD